MASEGRISGDTLRAVVEAAPDAILVADSKGRIVLVNAQVERLFGYAREELIGSAVEMLVPARFANTHRGYRAEYADSPRTRPMGAGLELSGRRKDGGEFTIEISLSPVGAAGDVIAIIRDVSDKRAADADLKHALAELRDRELRLRALFDHTFQFIGLLSPDGRLLEANQTALDFVGYTREEVIGKPFWETRWWTNGPRELPARLREAIAAAARGEFVRFETEHRGADGRVAAIDFSLTPIRNHAGQVTYLVPEGRDVSERKQLERLREEYVGFISHDLRSPLNNIALRAHILAKQLEGRSAGDSAENVQAIGESVQRIRRMVDELLEAAHLESEHFELRPRPIDLVELVRRTIAHAIPPSDGCRIELDLRPDRIPVEAEPERIERVLVNLITNALKYSPAESRISVSAAVVSNEAVVAVADSGPGIAPEETARIFDKYQRAPATRGVEGVGLGLYISRLIVAAHGGRIGVDTAPGRGSTFQFSLPLGEPSTHVVAIETRASMPASNPRRILIVEDDYSARAALRELLRDEGFVVDDAPDGEQALARLESTRPDILLLDLELPGMSGASLLRRARARVPDLDAIVMTGHAADVAAVLVSEFGVRCITKPVNVDELLGFLRRG